MEKGIKFAMGKIDRRRLTAYGGATLIILALIAGFLMALQIKRSSDALRPYIDKGVNAELDTALFDLETKMTRITSTLELAVQVTDWNAVTEQEIRNMLLKIQSSTDTYLVLYADTEGNAFSKDGDRYDLNLAEYQEAVDGFSDRTLYLEDDALTGRSAIVRVIPVMNEKKFGTFLAFLEPQECLEALTKCSFRSDSFYGCIDSDYATLFIGGAAQKNALLRGDLWENLKENAVSNSDWIVFSQKVRAQSKTSVECTADGVPTTIYARKVAGSNWWVLIGIEAHYFIQQEMLITEPMNALRWMLSIIFSLFFIVYLVVCLLFWRDSVIRAKELEGKADTDLLTGLTNKIATESQIREYMASPGDHKGVMILVDVDNFKKINDTMGHAFGDDVLRQLGIRLKSLYRVSDIIGRIGGDEFVVFLKDIQDEKVARRECRKMWTFFQGFEVGEYVKYSVTASLGAALYPSNGKTFEELYKSADTAVYLAKKGGRNKLVFYDDREMARTKDELKTKK